MSAHAKPSAAAQPAENARIDKFFVMAMAATGKSTFVRRHPHYRGYRVVDFAEELPPQRLSTRFLLYISRFIPAIRKAIHQRPDVQDRYRQAYFDKAFAFMDACDEPLHLLGVDGLHVGLTLRLGVGAGSLVLPPDRGEDVAWALAVLTQAGTMFILAVFELREQSSAD